jgi:hypothetical protein
MVTTEEDMDHLVGDINNLLMVVALEDLLWALNQATWDGSMVNMVVVVARLLHILGVDMVPHLHHREPCIRKGADHRWHPIVLAMVRGMREALLRRYRLQVVVEHHRRDQLRKLQKVHRAVLLMDRHLLAAIKGGGDILVKEISGDLSISGELDHRQCIVVGLRCINHRMAAVQACTVAVLILHHRVDSVIQEDLQKWWEAILEDHREVLANQVTIPTWICTLVEWAPATMTMMVRWPGETVPKTRDEGATNVEG